MKKDVFTFIAVLLCVAACQVEIVDPNESNVSGDVLSALIEQNKVTKTVLGESNNVLWSENDQIVAFMKSSYGHKYQIKPSFAGKTYADFSRISSASGDDLSAGIEWDHNVAYYPYSESIECVKSGDNYTLEVVLPAEQTYEENSFGNGTFPMVAVSEDNNITFKNVCGGIKLQLKGTQIVKSITIQGKNHEKLSGAATVTAYTDETKPAITMAQSASTSVTLNCGSGVQLSESTATEFIIALPPVLFSQGFSVTVTDSDSQTYTVETDKANTVLRSSLLVMPIFKLGSNPSDNESGNDDELIIPVSYVNLNPTLNLCEGDIAQLTATVGPKDATDKTVIWSSANSAIALVDQTGFVCARAAGSTTITAVAGGKSATCIVTVSVAIAASADYMDEYGINHGKGVRVGMTVWAPVNCGYHATDYKYGKLYQWGRKYGQGYDGDATTPTFVEGGVSEISGNHKNNANVFYYGVDGDWVDPRNDYLWNSGTESEPIKTNYDPCPEGWRVPTSTELRELIKNFSPLSTDENGLPGLWFSGTSTYTETVPQIFLPAAGFRHGFGITDDSRENHYYSYWSSSTNDFRSYHYYGGDSGGSMEAWYYTRDDAFSVRCVQE